MSAGSDTISLQATASGPGTTFSLSNITGGVIGNTVTDGTNGGAVKTADQLVSDINGNAALAGNIFASNSGGAPCIENESGSALTVTGVTGGAIDGGNGTDSIGGASVDSSLTAQFDDLRSQLDQLANDSVYNGVDLLRGDNLNAVFNEDGTSSYAVTGVTMDSAHLGLTIPLDGQNSAA